MKHGTDECENNLHHFAGAYGFDAVGDGVAHSQRAELEFKRGQG